MEDGGNEVKKEVESDLSSNWSSDSSSDLYMEEDEIVVKKEIESAPTAAVILRATEVAPPSNTTNVDLLAVIQRLEQQTAELQKKNEQLSLENQGRNEQLEKLQEERMLLQEDATALNANKEKLKRTISIFNQQLEEAESELESLQAQQADALEAQEVYEALEEEFDELLNENEELKESIEVQVKKVQSLWSMMTKTSFKSHLRSSEGRNDLRLPWVGNNEDFVK